MTHDETIDQMRKAISESYDPPQMVGSFIVLAEVIDGDGEPALLTWFDGGTQWSRLGTVEWVAARMRLEIPGLEYNDSGEDE